VPPYAIDGLIKESLFLVIKMGDIQRKAERPPLGPFGANVSGLRAGSPEAPGAGGSREGPSREAKAWSTSGLEPRVPTKGEFAAKHQQSLVWIGCPCAIVASKVHWWPSVRLEVSPERSFKVLHFCIHPKKIEIASRELPSIPSGRSDMDVKKKIERKLNPSAAFYVSKKCVHLYFDLRTLDLFKKNPSWA
jgi:hypothetical protein